MTVLTQEDQATISATIAEVESKTAGEVVVAVVGQSDDYAAIRFSTAALLTVVSAIFLRHAPIAWMGEFLIPLQIPIFFLWLQVTKVAALTRFLAKKASPERVRERAMRMFIERGIHNTRDQSGLLLMLSEVEQQVVILGDAGIHERVGDSGWEGYVNRIVAGFKGGQAASSIVEVLQELGATLATHFPPRDDDTNELSNDVVVKP